MTLDNEPATIASGQKRPIISVTAVAGVAQASITYADITTRLQVVPKVAADDGRLNLTIAVKKDTFLGEVNAAGLAAPIIGTKQTITQVRIPDGGTIVISGLREETSTARTEGLPWVKNIPVLGWLFKNDLTDGFRDELVVFLTAKVVDNPGQASVSPDEIPAAPGAPAPPGKTSQAPSAPAAPAAVLAASPTAAPAASPVAVPAAVPAASPAPQLRAERAALTEVGGR
jgi:type II secretory pathway component GspD/PulD (secretin)